MLPGNCVSGQTVIIWTAIKKRQFCFYSWNKSSVSCYWNVKNKQWFIPWPGRGIIYAK